MELARTGWNLWVRLLGRKHARKLMIGGLVVSVAHAVAIGFDRGLID